MRRVLLALVALLGLGACGTQVLDTPRAEEYIDDSVTEQVGANVESVECPEDLELEQGRTFDCEVRAADGTRGEVTVEQVDDEGTITADAPFLPVGSYERDIAESLSEQEGPGVAIECPEIVVGDAGDSFECAVAGGGDAATVLVTQKDAQGNVRYEVQR